MIENENRRKTFTTRLISIFAIRFRVFVFVFGHGWRELGRKDRSDAWEWSPRIR